MIDYGHITRSQAQHIVRLLDANFRAEIMARLGPHTPDDSANYYQIAIDELDKLREYVFGSSNLVECGLSWRLLKPQVQKKKRRKKKKKRRKL